MNVSIWSTETRTWFQDSCIFNTTSNQRFLGESTNGPIS
jgi:hypothetical protein